MRCCAKTGRKIVCLAKWSEAAHSLVSRAIATFPACRSSSDSRRPSSRASPCLACAVARPASLAYLSALHTWDFGELFFSGHYMRADSDEPTHRLEANKSDRQSTASTAAACRELSCINNV
ncbi:hypothetical protein CRV24_009327 [Beauveria bassiana]|nr:hypothetical protein CRV24_009327 [Beauveria bassiana]